MVSLYVIKRKYSREYFVGIEGGKFVMCKGFVAARVFSSWDEATDQVSQLVVLRSDPPKFQVVRKYFENVELIRI